MQRRTLLSTVASALSLSAAGCLSSFESGTDGDGDGSTGRDGTNTDAQTGTPANATCENEFTSPKIDAAPEFPAALAEAEVSAYVEAVERTLVLPPENQISDGYVSIGTITVESVGYGYLATVPVTGGYYNEAGEGTPTLHADLGHHTAMYFVNQQVLRRTVATGDTEPSDPRESGTLLRCRPA
ncbi:hypothetical protein [Haloarchaeobius sp. HME9146]|uniref:hypothetical protein n=1 Tax=Haloarchaeobius sp. HME9146 TaxID=2978732 RepID=UPI0021BF0B61|nr:hypothetical protein [Haloarchaeobius sp. HME9146]MCT9097341.1 hypothetical protein [Haloarchaeobius sp. HME9146]